MPNAPVDFVIITPLAEERDAVLNRLKGHEQLPPSEEDIRVYYRAEVPVCFPDGSRSRYSVIVLPLARMGQTEAATATGDAVRRWRPRYVLLVGIAGGIEKEGVRLGDVLVSDQVVDYELQKLEAGNAEFRWQVHRPDQRLLIAAQNFRDESWRDTTARRYDKRQAKVHFGPVCTGNKVIADESLVDQFREVWAKLIGVEMEAAGVANAASQASRQPGLLMIRGVSDLADRQKNRNWVKRWRPYACEIVAAWAVEFLESGPVPTPPDADTALAIPKHGPRDDDSREPTVASTSEFAVLGRFHVVHKGEVAIFVNGEKLEYDERSRPELEAHTREIALHEGDVVVIQILSRFVHRCLRMAFISNDGRLVLPLRIEHLGRVDGLPLQDISPAAIRASHKGATGARPDPKRERTWADLKLPMDDSEWLWGPEKNTTHQLAFVVQPSSFKEVRPHDAAARGNPEDEAGDGMRTCPASDEYEDGTNVPRGTPFFFVHSVTEDWYCPNESEARSGWEDRLRRLQERLEQIVDQSRPIACVLIERRIPACPEVPFSWEDALSGRELVQSGGGLGLEPTLLFTRDRLPLFGVFPIRDAKGTPMANSAGQAFGFRFGLSRQFFVCAERNDFREPRACPQRRLSELARDGTALLYQLPSNVATSLWRNWRLGFSRRAHSDEYLWLDALFELSWQRKPGDVLHTRRDAWSGNTSIELEGQALFPRLPDLSLFPGPISMPADNRYPVAWRCELPDVARASVIAIDELLERASEV